MTGRPTCRRPPAKQMLNEDKRPRRHREPNPTRWPHRALRPQRQHLRLGSAGRDVIPDKVNPPPWRHYNYLKSVTIRLSLMTDNAAHGLCRGCPASGGRPGQPPANGGMARNGRDRKPLAMTAFARSTKKDPAGAISRKALGDGPQRFATTCIVPIATGSDKSQKPLIAMGKCPGNPSEFHPSEYGLRAILGSRHKARSYLWPFPAPAH